MLPIVLPLLSTCRSRCSLRARSSSCRPRRHGAMRRACSQLLGCRSFASAAAALPARARSHADAGGYVDPIWRFAFGGRATGSVAHKVTAVRVASMAKVISLTTSIRESPNAQQFRQDGGESLVTCTVLK